MELLKSLKEKKPVLKGRINTNFQIGLVFFSIITFISIFLLNSGLQAQPNKIGINFKISNYGNTTAKTDPAVAYNSQDDEYFVVWFDETNQQVWGRIISGSDPANSTTNSFRIDGGYAIDPARPAVAYNSDNNQYFVIWETSGSPVQYITGRAYDAQGNALDTSTLTYWPGWSARVEYCPDNSQYLIVYINFKNVNGFWVNANYRMGASYPFLIGDSKINIKGIGLAKGSDQYFMAVWGAQWDYNNEEYSGIRGNFIHATQNLGSNSFQISWYDGQWYGASYPAVAFNPDTKKYLVIWRDTRHHQNPYDNHSIYGQYVDQATTQQFHQNNFQITPKSTTVDKQNPAIVFDKAHNSFLATWDQDDIYGQMVQDTTTVGQPLAISTAANSQNSSQLVFNSTRDEIACVWEDHRFSPAEIYGQRIGIVQSIFVDKPAAGDVWNAGSTRYIRWHCHNFTDSVRILISYDGYNPQFWVAVDFMKNTPNDGSYEWIVPNNPSKNCVIMIIDARDGDPVGYSGVFEITGSTASITVLAPNGGENLQAGSEYEIQWTSSNFNDPVRIDLFCDTAWDGVAENIPNSGSHIWTVPNISSTNCLIYVGVYVPGDPDEPDLVPPYDFSDAPFAISSADTGNTQAGFEVPVTLSDDVNVIFDEVTTAGNTTLDTSHAGPQPPNNFVVHPQSAPMFYDINTTASYSGWIHININYDDTELDTEMENLLRLFKYIEPHSEWLGITTSVDIENNFIHGQTDSLSVFAIMFETGDAGEEGTIVTNCDDSGPGSLRDAILYANNNPGPDTIRFQIPASAPGYDSAIGVWMIAPQSVLPTITESLCVDGFSQKEFIGEDTNPDGPEIWLNGELAGQYAHGLRSTAAETEILGLTISNFQNAGIGLHDVDGGRISGCYVGVDYSGSGAAANHYGIWLGNNTCHVTISPSDTFKNVISGNLYGGIVVADTSSHINILGNIIGLNRTGMYPIGNGNYGGIRIEGQCDSVAVFDNWIGGNKFGISIFNSQHITIGNNFIGSNKIDNEILELGNESYGLWLALEAHDNLITENFIRFNGSYGVYIEGTNTICNRVSHNHISGNGWYGIYNESGGNLELAPPVISSASATSVIGTAIPNATVEIYTDPEDEGLIFQGETNSDASGNFTWNGAITGPFTNVTAIAIDDSGNTSAFSQVAVITNVENLAESNSPETFSLSQNYPNPFNPNTTIQFDIPFTGKQMIKVQLRIYNLSGELIRTLVNEEKSPGIYQVHWDGMDETGNQVASGIYLCQFRAGDFNHSRKMILMK